MTIAESINTKINNANMKKKGARDTDFIVSTPK